MHHKGDQKKEKRHVKFFTGKDGDSIALRPKSIARMLTRSRCGTSVGAVLSGTNIKAERKNTR